MTQVNDPAQPDILHLKFPPLTPGKVYDKDMIAKDVARLTELLQGIARRSSASDEVAKTVAAIAKKRQSTPAQLCEAYRQFEYQNNYQQFADMEQSHQSRAIVAQIESDILESNTPPEIANTIKTMIPEIVKASGQPAKQHKRPVKRASPQNTAPEQVVDISQEGEENGVNGVDAQPQAQDEGRTDYDNSEMPDAPDDSVVDETNEATGTVDDQDQQQYDDEQQQQEYQDEEQQQQEATDAVEGQGDVEQMEMDGQEEQQDGSQLMISQEDPDQEQQQYQEEEEEQQQRQEEEVQPQEYQEEEVQQEQVAEEEGEQQQQQRSLSSSLCSWCARDICQSMRQRDHPIDSSKVLVLCCQCWYSDESARQTEDGSVEICTECDAAKFVCTVCFAEGDTDCLNLGFTYVTAQPTGIHCCLCYTGSSDPDTPKFELCELCVARVQKRSDEQAATEEPEQQQTEETQQSNNGRTYRIADKSIYACFKYYLNMLHGECHNPDVYDYIKQHKVPQDDDDPASEKIPRNEFWKLYHGFHEVEFVRESGSWSVADYYTTARGGRTISQKILSIVENIHKAVSIKYPAPMPSMTCKCAVTGEAIRKGQAWLMIVKLPDKKEIQYQLGNKWADLFTKVAILKDWERICKGKLLKWESEGQSDPLTEENIEPLFNQFRAYTYAIFEHCGCNTEPLPMEAYRKHMREEWLEKPKQKPPTKKTKPKSNGVTNPRKKTKTN